MQGEKISPKAASNNQVLKWNSGLNEWTPATDTGTAYSAGTGISIASGSISAKTTSALWNANQIEGENISLTAPTNNQVLKWNSGLNEWTPATDTSGSGGSYTAGTGISFNGSAINSSWTNSGINLYNNNTGFVGIGKTNPYHGLDVSYAINTDSAYMLNGIQVLSTRGVFNLFIGKSAGNSNTGYYNVFSGYRAGYANTSGGDNLFSGYEAGYANTSGSRSVYTGYEAGFSNTTANNNLFDGYSAGYSNTTGNNNTFSGYNSGYYTSTGLSNSFYGASSGNYNTTGSHNSYFGNKSGYYAGGMWNSFFGDSSGYNNTTGGNSFFGYASGVSNTYGVNNSFYGYKAGYSNINYAENSFFGDSAGYKNNANGNSFFGNAAGTANTSGSANVYIGDDAGYLSTSGYENVYIGYQCGYNNSSGNYNLYNGYKAGYTNTSGSLNVFLGASAGYLNTKGSQNVFSGVNAGYYNDNGIGNVFEGYGAGNANTEGSYNVFEGSYTGYSNTLGQNNVFCGSEAGYKNTTGFGNTFNGTLSGYVNITGNHNVFSGDSSGYSNTTGYSNSFFGTTSGYTNKTGYRNTFIGDSADATTNNLANATAIGYNAKVSASNAIVLGNGANVGIGTSTPNAKAILDLTSTTQGFLAPRMLSTQRTSISGPAKGLLVFDNDSSLYFYYNGSTWKPIKSSGGGSGTTYNAGGGITISGTKISADSNNAVWNANKIDGKNISPKAPANNQVLKYNSGLGEWTPATDTSSGATFTSGTGISITGGAISATNTVAMWNANQIEGKNISPKAPANNQVMKWNSGLSEWAPATDTTTTYTPGTGLSLTGNAFSAQNTTALWNASQLEGKNVSPKAPANNQIMKWNSGLAEWTPATDTSGITYTPGTGISISGTAINSTWTVSGNKIYNNNTSYVGIGKTSAYYPLDVYKCVNTDSSYNIQGFPVLQDNLDNLYVGVQSGNNKAATQSNTLLGNQCGGFMAAGAGSNTFVGSAAGYSDKKGIFNTFLGTQAGYSNTSGSSNTFIGDASGMNDTGGTDNTFIGTEAGLTNMTGNYNTLLGAFSDVSSSNLSEATAIGYGAIVAKSSCIVLGATNTQVGIGGVTAPGYTLQLATNSAAKPGSATWTIASDARLKKNVTPYTDGLDVLNQINPVWFQYTGEAGMPTGQKFVGVIAQDMQKIAPYMVGNWNYQDNKGNKTNYLDYDANSLFYILVNSVKAQQQQIVAKDSVINTQQQQISSLQAQVNTQQALTNEILSRLSQLEQCTNCNPSVNTTTSSTITNLPASLDQNNPNPFSQNTTIGYFIPQITKSATIVISTLQGNQIQSFVITSTGKGQIMLSAGVLSAGEYLYTLVVDGVKVDSKKMMIVKE